MSFSLRFEINNKPTSDGRHSVMLRLTKERKLARLKTQYLVKKSTFHAKAQFGKWIRSSEPRHAVLNNGLKNLYDDLFDFINSYLNEQDADAKMLIQAFKNRKSLNNQTWIAYGEAQVNHYKSVGKERYALKMKVALNKLEVYLKGNDLALNQTDLAMIKGFDAYLREIGNSPNTVDVNLKVIKLIYRRAMDEGLIENPNLQFLKYSVKTTSVERDKLTIGELKLLEDLELEKYSWEWHARNYFVFALYMGGMRFGDLVELSWSNIKDGSRLDYLMNKTGKRQMMRMPRKALEILDLYPLKDGKSDTFIFPLLPRNYFEQPIAKRIKIVSSKNVLVNRYLAEVVKKAKIQKKVSFHIARHSFAYIAYSQTKDPMAVKKALQHSKLKETQDYINSLGNDGERDILGEIFD